MNIVSGVRYQARWGPGGGDIDAALALRRHCFRASATDRDDRDAHDATCDHLIVTDTVQHLAVATCRIRVWPDGAAIGCGYAAQFYDLNALMRYNAPMMEIGRLCIRAGLHDTDILRVVWAAITRAVDARSVAMLFGCTSMPAPADVSTLAQLAHLARTHPAPSDLRPRAKAPDFIAFADLARNPDQGLPATETGIPAILRSYLGMGGWISDHAVMDRDLGTAHVFTALEVARIPAARARLLREAAASR